MDSMAEMGDGILWLTLTLGFPEESLNAEIMVTVMKETTWYNIIKIHSTGEENSGKNSNVQLWLKAFYSLLTLKIIMQIWTTLHCK